MGEDLVGLGLGGKRPERAQQPVRAGVAGLEAARGEPPDRSAGATVGDLWSG